jgi:hypothetical protein
MKREQEPASGWLLTSEDSVRIRNLSIEKSRILQRLRELDEREIATFIPRQYAEIQNQPIAGR